MKSILNYIKEYFYELDKWLFAAVSMLAAILIFLNYHFLIDNQVGDLKFSGRFTYRFIIFFIAFAIPYLLYAFRIKKNIFSKYSFVVLLIVAPAIFALKAGKAVNIAITDNPGLNEYWNQVIYWPFLLLITLGLLFICWFIYDRNQPFYGSSIKSVSWTPYAYMLLFMIPLIAAASTQPDFLAVYPKLNRMMDSSIREQLSWWQQLLFEISYGSDFIGIEFFFRGFLILAFIKWVGKDAILPMACFYCTIHFGKPLGECISSYFGGLLLGIVVYNTRSVWGGLMVHLGIAWLMELGGYLGHYLNN